MLVAEPGQTGSAAGEALNLFRRTANGVSLCRGGNRSDRQEGEQHDYRDMGEAAEPQSHSILP